MDLANGVFIVKSEENPNLTGEGVPERERCVLCIVVFGRIVLTVAEERGGLESSIEEGLPARADSGRHRCWSVLTFG